MGLPQSFLSAAVGHTRRKYESFFLQFRMWVGLQKKKIYDEDNVTCPLAG
jgi:hypothetical protein